MRFSLFLFVVFLFNTNFLLAQIAPNHYLVNFTDKYNISYSLNQPEKFLSQKAIERRTKYHIKYDETDLPVNETYIDSLKALGLKIINISKWFNSVSVYTKDSLLIDTLDKISFIKSVGYHYHNKNKEKKKLTLNTKNKYKQDLNFDSLGYDYYGQAFRQTEMLNLQYLHKEGFRGQGMLIAILDAGFYKVNELAAFDSIRINKQIIATYDFVDKDTSVYDAATHGMMVLSTIAGNLPGEFVGTAPKANFLLLRTEQTASEYLIEEHNWAVAAEYADSMGVDIINSSLGYNNFDDTLQSHHYQDMDGNTTIISRAADLAAKKGILVVSSAGNEGFSDWRYITAPADADSILSVGAVTEDKNIAFFSSAGPTSDGQIKPDVCALGMPAAVCATDGSINSSSGTSFSAPITTGAISCLWQAHPELNNMQIIDAIRRSADRYGQPDTLFGYGIPDFYAAHIYLNTIGKIDEHTNNFLNIFPNPFKNSLNIVFYSNNIQVPYSSILEVFDTHGKKILEQKFTDSETKYKIYRIDFNEKLSKGLYIIRFTANNKVLQQKLIKM